MSIVLQLSHDCARAVVAVTGEPDLEESGILYAALAELIDSDGELNVVLDLRDLVSINPAVIRVLNSAGTLVRERGGQVLARGTRLEPMAVAEDHSITAIGV
jgi:anti-anti-sigma regulatory factor